MLGVFTLPVIIAGSWCLMRRHGRLSLRDGSRVGFGLSRGGADRDSFRGIPLVPVSFNLCLKWLPGGLSSYCFAYTLLGLDGLGRALGNHGFPGVVDSM